MLIFKFQPRRYAVFSLSAYLLFACTIRRFQVQTLTCLVMKHDWTDGTKALGKLGNIVAETLLRKHCFLPMFRHVSKSGQTLGNISEQHRETSNVSEFGRKHFCFPGSKFCFRNNVSTGGQTWKYLRKHRESQMFPQQCFLVCPELKECRRRLQCLYEYMQLCSVF
jgi:hypothetical protein